MTRFDVGKEGVLLSFVESVNFVDEDDGAVFDFFDAGEHGAEGDEFGLREARDQPRQRGFSAAGRAPEKHRANVVGFDLQAQRLAGAEKFFLADEFVERARTHALRKRLVGGGNVGVRGGPGEFGEEAHGILESRAFE